MTEQELLLKDIVKKVDNMIEPLMDENATLRIQNTVLRNMIDEYILRQFQLVNVTRH